MSARRESTQRRGALLDKHHVLMDARDAAVTSSRSEHWEVRAAAARELVKYTDPLVERCIERLLDDPNTAVIEVAVEALLRQADTRCAALFLTAYSQADDHVGDHMNDVVRELWGRNFPLPDLCLAVLREGDEQAKAGAAALLRWLGVGSP